MHNEQKGIKKVQSQLVWQIPMIAFCKGTPDSTS